MRFIHCTVKFVFCTQFISNQKKVFPSHIKTDRFLFQIVIFLPRIGAINGQKECVSCYKYHFYNTVCSLLLFYQQITISFSITLINKAFVFKIIICFHSKIDPSGIIFLNHKKNNQKEEKCCTKLCMLFSDEILIIENKAVMIAQVLKINLLVR